MQLDEQLVFYYSAHFITHDVISYHVVYILSCCDDDNLMALGWAMMMMDKPGLLRVQSHELTHAPRCHLFEHARVPPKY